MKKYELTQEQLTYLHSVDAVKEQIEDWFPELKKPSLEVGKWYKSSLYAKKLYCFTSFKNREFSAKRYYYGFNDGEWVTSWTDSNELDKSWTLATPQEVEEALTKEAVKRGFNDGVKIERPKSFLDRSGVVTLKKNASEYSFFEDVNRFEVYRWTVFDNGTWAEILPNTLPSDIEQLSLKYGKEALINYLKD